ncbi:MAG: DUF4825 domain-containing protein, partial [Clostridia bacterium]
GDTKERVKNVLNYKKPAFWVIAVALLAVVAIGIGLVANPKEKSAEPDAAQTLWDARTEYVGDNSAVGKLIGLLEFPDSLTYRFFALQTGEDERGVELNFIQDTNRSLTDLETWQLDKNALLLFALIGNLEDVRYSGGGRYSRLRRERGKVAGAPSIYCDGSPRRVYHDEARAKWRGACGKSRTDQG